MIKRFLEWRQNRKTDRMLARIRCLSGEHEMSSGDSFGYCRHCGVGAFEIIVARRFREDKE